MLRTLSAGLVLLAFGAIPMFGGAGSSPVFADAESNRRVEFHITEQDVTKHIVATADLDTIEVMFNPTEFTISKAVPWKNHDFEDDSPSLEFLAGQPFSLNVELTFDTSDTGDDVSQLTAALQRAAQSGNSSPPAVSFTWGNLTFRAGVKVVDVKFTLFSSDGTPVRAVAQTAFEDLKRAPLSAVATR